MPTSLRHKRHIMRLSVIGALVASIGIAAIQSAPASAAPAPVSSPAGAASEAHIDRIAASTQPITSPLLTRHY